jgi:hypothetical protein
MDEVRKARKKGGPILAVMMLLLPVLYVAGSGPAVAMVMRRSWREFDTYNFAYAPVVATEKRSEAFGRAMGWWRGFFVNERLWQLHKAHWQLEKALREIPNSGVQPIDLPISFPDE